MPTPNNSLADRTNPPDVIYVEDSQDWLVSSGFPDLVRNGLGRTVSWYEEVDDALLLIAKEERIEEAQGYIRERVSPYRSELSEEEKQEVVSFIDPERLRGKIFVFDNEVPGWLNGVDLIEAILQASQGLSEGEKPRIISLICSNPDVVEGKPDLFHKWDAGGVEILFKGHYPFFVFWMGQVLRGEGGRFRKWFKEMTCRI